jgi:hypothetical protein
MTGIMVIDLQEERRWDDCSMCDQYRRLDHAVAWCCGPTHDEIGSMSTEYRDTEVGGMPVCKSCHDTFYAEPSK